MKATYFVGHKGQDGVQWNFYVDYSDEVSFAHLHKLKWFIVHKGTEIHFRIEHRPLSSCYKLSNMHLALDGSKIRYTLGIGRCRTQPGSSSFSRKQLELILGQFAMAISKQTSPLEELEAYREIGTIKEIKKAMKKPKDHKTPQ